MDERGHDRGVVNAVVAWAAKNVDSGGRARGVAAGGCHTGSEHGLYEILEDLMYRD